MTHSECALEDALKVGRDDARERYFEGEDSDAVDSPAAAQEEPVIDTRSKYRRGRRWWDERS
jgi:hypothetical protein